MEGYKTQIVTLVGTILTLVAVFGVDVTPEQREAVIAVVVAAWPVGMLVMRAVSRGPMKIPFTGRLVRGKVQTPWWVVCGLLALMILGGCKNSAELTPRAQEILNSDVMQTVLASDLPETMIIVGTMKAIESSDDRAAKAARYRVEIQLFEAAVQGASVRAAVLERLITSLLEGRRMEPSDRLLLQRGSRFSAELAGPDEYITGVNLERLKALLTELEDVTHLYDAS